MNINKYPKKKFKKFLCWDFFPKMSKYSMLRFLKKLSEKYFFQKYFGKLFFSKIFWKIIFFKNIWEKYFFRKNYRKIFFLNKYFFRKFLKKGGGGGVTQLGVGVNEDLINISSSLHLLKFQNFQKSSMLRFCSKRLSVECVLKNVQNLRWMCDVTPELDILFAKNICTYSWQKDRRKDRRKEGQKEGQTDNPR